MRVIGGTAGGVRLRVPSAPRGVRPTTDAIRETLFNSLQAAVPGSRFLDLYAGAGSVGIEALSRGAAFAVFVERSRHCLKAIRQNLENTGLAERAVVVAGDVPRVLSTVCAEHGPFDIVFVDPPYEAPALLGVLERLVLQRRGLASGAVVVVQHEVQVSLNDVAAPQRQKLLGRTCLSFFSEEAAAGAGES